MKFKRKIAGLLAALMVLTLGSTTAFADTYDSPSAGDYEGSTEEDDYYKVRETIEPGMTYVATGTDSKTPWVVIEGTDQVKNLDASVTKALAYKSTKNPNKAIEIIVHGGNLASVKLSQANMTTLASRDGYLTVNGGKSGAWDSLRMEVKNGKALDFSVAIKNNDVVTSKLKAAGYAKETCQFTIGGTGKLNGPSSIYYHGDNYTGTFENINGYLYLYNAASDKLEYVGEAYMSSDGQSFGTYWGSRLVSAGKYVIVTEKLPASVTTGNVITPTVSDDETDEEITKTVTDEINKSTKGDAVKITNIPSNLKVEQKVFTAAKDKGVSLLVDSPKNNATFKFDNFDKVNEMSGAFDPTVTIGNSIVDDIDKAMSDSKISYLTVAFAYDGKLPGKTAVTLDVSEGGFKEGATVYLYYFNEKTKAFELVDEAKYTDGFTTFEMEHCSDYIVTAEKLDSKEASATPATKTPVAKNNTAKTPKTGDMNPIIPFAIILLAGVAAIVVAFSRKKRA